MNLLRRLVSTLGILLALVVIGSGSARPIHAAELAAPACGLATVHGSYDFVAPATVNVGAGTVIAVPDHLLYASPAVYASKGTIIFDGAGTTILIGLENFNGPLDSPLSLYGDYAVDSDCAATVTFAGDTQLTVKMVDKNRTLVSTTQGFVILRSRQ